MDNLMRIIIIHRNWGCPYFSSKSGNRCRYTKHNHTKKTFLLSNEASTDNVMPVFAGWYSPFIHIHPIVPTSLWSKPHPSGGLKEHETTIFPRNIQLSDPKDFFAGSILHLWHPNASFTPFWGIKTWTPRGFTARGSSCTSHIHSWGSNPKGDTH